MNLSFRFVRFFFFFASFIPSVINFIKQQNPLENGCEEKAEYNYYFLLYIKWNEAMKNGIGFHYTHIKNKP